MLALTRALAVRRSSFDAVGGFDEMLAVCPEDVDLSGRMLLSGGEPFSPCVRGSTIETKRLKNGK